MKMAEDIAQGKIGLQDALTQAKSNMYNQRTGGFNAQNQFLNTVDNFLRTAVGAEGQNLAASQAEFETYRKLSQTNTSSLPPTTGAPTAQQVDP